MTVVKTDSQWILNIYWLNLFLSLEITVPEFHLFINLMIFVKDLSFLTVFVLSRGKKRDKIS